MPHRLISPRSLLGALLALALGAAALLAFTAPASAASQTATGGSLSWGVKQEFRAYVTGPIGGGSIAGVSPAAFDGGTGITSFPTASGAVDQAAPSVDVSFGGGVNFVAHGGALNVTISNPRLATSGATGALYVDFGGSTIAIADLGGVTYSGGTATSLTVAASSVTLTAAGVPVFTSYPAGTALDPLSATIALEALTTATTTTLSAAPASPQTAGASVTFTATVSPAASGTVQFTDGGAALGAPQPVSGGVATLTTSALGAGSHTIGAAFTSSDLAFLDSTATTIGYVIDAAPSAVTPTVTTPTASAPQSVPTDVATANPVAAGTTVTFATTVSDGAAGTVQFLDNGAPLGSPAAVAAGIATLATSALAPGRHAITATFAPANPAEFNPATSPADAGLIYRIVDATNSAACTLGANPTDVIDASASWKISSYIAAWPTRTATGDVTVDEPNKTFLLGDGAGSATANCTVIDFDGSFAVKNTGRGDVQFLFANPTLTIASNGSGSLEADVSVSIGAAQLSGPTRLPIARFSAASVTPDASGAVSFEVTPAYAGTVAPGAFDGDFDSAFPAPFLLAAPASTRGYFHESSQGSLASQLLKPASPLGVSYTLDAIPTATSLSASPAGSSVTGEAVTLTATVAAASPATGTVEFRDGSTVLGSAPVAGGIATLSTTALAAGTHALRAEFVPTGIFAGSSSEIVSYVVADPAAPPAPPVVEPVAPAAPVVSLSVGEVEQGGTITVTGTGFAKGDGISAEVRSDPVSLGTAIAGADGTVAFSWTVPVDFETGQHTVILTGSGISASATFVVVAPAPSCTARAVSGGTLSWGVKAAFVSYVQGPIANGTASFSGWGSGSGTVNADAMLGTVSYRGTAAFNGHGGLLQLTVANPRIQLTGPSSALLLADITSKALDGGAVTQQSGVALASLALGSGANNSTANLIAYSSVPATLTASGAYAFSGFYPAGTALDPVTFAMPLGAQVDCTPAINPASSSNLASTGASSAAPGVLGALLVLVGGALALAGRRRFA